MVHAGQGIGHGALPLAQPGVEFSRRAAASHDAATFTASRSGQPLDGAEAGRFRVLKVRKPGLGIVVLGEQARPRRRPGGLDCD
ncbi:MAG: hypothetical protein JXP73_03285 [Deltaproteobacteria bacterium]|nr:hypothetical protein [Deltaproteobacteria bacterium]